MKICKKNWEEANVPADGSWIVDRGDGLPINSDGASSFTVPDYLPSVTNLLINYRFNNESVTRTVKVE